MKKDYAEVERFTGPGDMGRDVVGFLTKKRHEGPWHNYQCKQYGRTLSTATGIQEVGKVLYYSSQGEFTPPTAFFFVAPRGVNRNLKGLIAKPEEFRRTLIDRWEDYCANGISEGKHIALGPALGALIETWDFSLIRAISVDSMLNDAAARAVLFSWFGADPGPPPAGAVPAIVEDRETAVCPASSSKSREFHSAHGPSRIFRSSGGMAKLVRASSRTGQEGKTT